MRILRSTLLACFVVASLGSSACNQPAKSPDVASDVRKSLDNAGIKNVSVSQDRDRGIVTLSGHVPADGDKARAESIAKSIAGNQVVANQILVEPPKDESDAKKIGSDLDKAIGENLDAALVQRHWKDNVRYEVKNGVVTLKGNVNSEATRSEVQRVAAGIPNVTQVVNSLQIKNQKATSSQ